MDIERDHYEFAYHLGRRIHEGKMRLTEARDEVARAGVNLNSAVALLNDFRHMLEGTRYTRALSSSAIDSCLPRLKAAGTIRQLPRGLYDHPVNDPVLGTVAPSADAIARALVARDAIRIQPSGAHAASVLGLSNQVPSRIVFLTDGPAREVKIGRSSSSTPPRETWPRLAGLAAQSSRRSATSARTRSMTTSPPSCAATSPPPITAQSARTSSILRRGSPTCSGA